MVLLSWRLHALLSELFAESPHPDLQMSPGWLAWSPRRVLYPQQYVSPVNLGLRNSPSAGYLTELI